MTGYERVIGTIQGTPVDHIPVGGTLSLYGAKLTGCDLKTYFTSSDAYIKGQVAIVETFQPDIILTPIAVARESESFGSEIKYFKDAPPNVRRRKFTKVSDLKDFELPPFEDPYFTYIFESIKGLSDLYKGKIAIGALWLDPFNCLANIVGPELFMELLFYNRDKFDWVIEQLTSFSVDYANRMLACGADFIIDFASLCNTAMVTKELAETVIYPVLESAYGQIEGGIVLHHGGYKIGPFIPVYRSLPNLLGFLLDKSDDLAKARQDVLPGQLILGNISGAQLDLIRPDKIALMCDILHEKMKGFDHFIQFTSSADIPYTTSNKQIQTFMESVKHGGVKDQTVLGISCGIFEKELELLEKDNRLPIKFKYLDSKLHMRPDDLKIALDKEIEKQLKTYDKILLVYGDCHPYMIDNCESDRVFRVDGINCCNIVMGAKDYKRLRREGAFFVFHEWAHRWKELFVDDIGLTPELAPVFMNDLHSSIVYIDTGVGEVPVKILENMSSYFQLPYDVLEVNLDTFQEAIMRAYSEVKYE